VRYGPWMEKSAAVLAGGARSGASAAPAVSNFEAGVNGFSIDEANALLRGLRGLDIVGTDVVCLMPSKDQPNQITAMVAAHIMFELTCLIADRLAVAGGTTTSASAS
jgi:hypothetical protein